MKQWGENNARHGKQQQPASNRIDASEHLGAVAASEWISRPHAGEDHGRVVEGIH